MSDEAKGHVEPGGAEAPLELRRQAARGFGVGAAVALAVFGFFVVLPGARSAGLYLGLAVVLGVSVGLLATGLLVALRVRGLARAR